MHIAKIFGVVLWRKFLLPNYIGYKIFISKDFVEDLSQVSSLSVINVDEEYSIATQQVASKN